MLHRIGDEDNTALYASIGQSLVENPACRTDKGFSLFIFLVARLLADQHNTRPRRAFAWHHLSRMLVEWATGAIFFCSAQRLQRFDD
jgi:hypothetical protein